MLEERLANSSRQQLGKLVDLSRLRELLGSFDDSALYDDDLTVDTSQYSPDEVASTINAHVARGGTP